MKESALERKVVAYCKSQGMLCYKFSSPARRGVPDRLILYKGRALFLEFKRPGESPTPLQWREIDILNAAGHYATWVNTFEGARKEIEDFFGSGI